MPSLDGPRDVLWCTRYPLNTRTVPLSIRVGTDTSRARRGFRRTSWTPGSRFSCFAASSSWLSALIHADSAFTFGSPSFGTAVQPNTRISRRLAATRGTVPASWPFGWSLRLSLFALQPNHQLAQLKEGVFARLAETP